MTTIPRSELTRHYAFCDPSGGKTDLKATRSRAAIVVAAADVLGRIFIMYAWAGRPSTNQLMDEILKVNDRFAPKVFGVEANGLQALFGDAILRDANLRGKSLNLSQVWQPTHQEKANRIRTTLQPIIAHGRLFLQEDMIELKYEITSFPMNPRMDLIDATASVVRLIPPAATRSEREASVDTKAAYLRATGAPAWFISQECGGDRR